MDNDKSKITLARTNLILDHAFFGTLALKLDPIIGKQRPTAWTDGKVLGFNPDYLKSLSMPETQTVICHEVLHVGMGHPWREGGRNHKLWNRACDYAINGILKESRFVFPQDPPILYDPRFTGMPAEQIYTILDQEKRAKDKENEEAKEPDLPQEGRKDPGQGNGQGEGEKGQETTPDAQAEGKNEEELAAEDVGMGEVVECAEEDSQAMEADWQVAMFQAAQAAMAQGTLPGSLKGIIEKMKEPKVDWKAALWRFMQQCATSDYRWTKPNRRYLPMGIYLPSLQSEALPPIVVGWDTSGSTHHKQEEFASEVADVIQSVRPETTHIVYADAKVQAVDEFTPDEKITFRPGGFGGTSFIPVFDWVEKEGIQPACLIYFTDLEGTFPETEPPYPVLWIDCAGLCEAPFGETIKIP